MEPWKDGDGKHLKGSGYTKAMLAKLVQITVHTNNGEKEVTYIGGGRIIIEGSPSIKKVTIATPGYHDKNARPVFIVDKPESSKRTA